MALKTSTILGAGTVLRALRSLEATVAAGESVGLEQFDWNKNWVHGFAARDVSRELRRRFGFPDSLTWNQVSPFLKELAAEGRLVEVKVGQGRRRKPVPLYRTVGG